MRVNRCAMACVVFSTIFERSNHCTGLDWRGFAPRISLPNVSCPQRYDDFVNSPCAHSRRCAQALICFACRERLSLDMILTFLCDVECESEFPELHKMKPADFAICHDAMLLLPSKITYGLPLMVTVGPKPSCYGSILSTLVRRTFGSSTYLSHLPCMAWIIGSMSNSVCVGFWSSYWGMLEDHCDPCPSYWGRGIPGGVDGQGAGGRGWVFFGVPQKYIAPKNHHTNKP